MLMRRLGPTVPPGNWDWDGNTTRGEHNGLKGNVQAHSNSPLEAIVHARGVSMLV